jgi:TolB protein
MRLCAAVAAAGLVIAIAPVAATRAHATAPGANGLIAFSRYRFVDSPLRREIWVQNVDGSGLRRLTRVGPNVIDSQPSWAPDGSRLVFTRCGSGPKDSIGEGHCAIWSVNADGSDLRRLSARCSRTGDYLTSGCPDDAGATFSPDGRQLLFGRWAGKGTVMVSDTQLRHARLVFSYPGSKGTPDIGSYAWSPDGNQLAFQVYNDNGGRFKPINGRAIFVVKLDGTGLHRLTPWSLRAGGWDDRVDWSPDGTHIVFHNLATEHNGPLPPDGDLYTIRSDGTDLRRLTHLPTGTGVQLGSFSPDSNWIVFSTSNGAKPTPHGDQTWPDVYVIKTDGTGLTNITKSTNWDGTPDWGPVRTGA